MKQAIETTGSVDDRGHLHLNEPLNLNSAQSVRVILLFDSEADIAEEEWLRAAARNRAFDVLRHPEEDIYTLEDGRPFSEKPA